MNGEASGSSSQKDSIAQALNRIANDGPKFMNGDPGAREKLVESARELVAMAENPIETLLWNIWAQPTRTVAARIAIDLKVFGTAVQDSGRPKTDVELAAPTGASPTLVKRIARACVSMRMLDEKGPGLYVPNTLTKVLARPEYAAGVVFWSMPAYLRATKFQNPEDPANGPFQYANKCGYAFGWLTEHPEVFHAFHGYVHALRLHRPNWVEMYPVQQRLVEGIKAEGDASALVDVGGGTGQILQDFRESVLQYTGRLVLQELPEVIAAATGLGVGQDSGIELQVHDFFAPQPVKGARAYFMRSDAMVPGYSRILISDCIIADENAAWQHVSLDFFMMALASAQERTEREWHALIDSCGLKIAGIYNKGQGNEGFIEIVI
ncbi:S-adenosyl-L-methionine-dependent methyltransferase [Whalleya microplaca]|nr:S-adenosyl-L-methionine-dependent methyltransferase [Whalleya microplaca]